MWEDWNRIFQNWNLATRSESFTWKTLQLFFNDIETALGTSVLQEMLRTKQKQLRHLLQGEDIEIRNGCINSTHGALLT